MWPWALLALVSGWPIHDIGETALFTLHMIEHMVIALVVPALLLRGTPRWLADITLGNRHVARVLRPLGQAGPRLCDLQHHLRPHPLAGPGRLDADQSLDPLCGPRLAVRRRAPHVAAVFSPTKAIPRLQPPLQMLYLFLMSLLPTVPASFLTFSTVPLYPVYGEAAFAYGLTPVADQTIAGIVMKVGGRFPPVGRPSP